MSGLGDQIAGTCHGVRFCTSVCMWVVLVEDLVVWACYCSYWAETAESTHGRGSTWLIACTYVSLAAGCAPGMAGTAYAACVEHVHGQEGQPVRMRALGPWALQCVSGGVLVRREQCAWLAAHDAWGCPGLGKSQRWASDRV